MHPLSPARHRLPGAAAFGLALPAAHARTAWPARPATFIVPFPAGGGADAFARPLAAALNPPRAPAVGLKAPRAVKASGAKLD